MIKNNNRCCSCSHIFLYNFTLDCQHSICTSCLDQLLKEEESQESLNDELQIKCSACSYVTLIAVALAYKIVRPSRQAKRSSNHCKKMVCMDCLDGCFSIDEYVNGEHSSHQVLPLSRAYVKMKDILFYDQKQLQQSVSQNYLQTEKLIHCKSMLNDIFNANVLKIKMAFENLKEQIVKRQIQVLDYYQDHIYQLFNSIDEQILESKKRVEICKNHIQQIGSLFSMNSPNNVDSENVYGAVIYFIQNRKKLDGLTLKNINDSIIAWMNELEQNRKIIDLNEQRQLQKSIRTLQVLKRFDDKSTTTSTTSLSRQYFEAKRKEIFNQTSQHDLLTRLRSSEYIDSIQRTESQKGMSNERKRVQIKHRLKSYFPK